MSHNVRASRQLLEKGEQCTAYFFLFFLNLKKQQEQFNSIHKPIVNSVITYPKLIAKYCSAFYNELFKSSQSSTYDVMNIKICRNHSAEWKSRCDAFLTLGETRIAILKLKSLKLLVLKSRIITVIRYRCRFG